YFLQQLSPPPLSTLFPYTTLFRSAFDADLSRYARADEAGNISVRRVEDDVERLTLPGFDIPLQALKFSPDGCFLAAMYSRHQARSEEHTSELQSRGHLVCRLLLEK